MCIIPYGLVGHPVVSPTILFTCGLKVALYGAITSQYFDNELTYVLGFGDSILDILQKILPSIFRKFLSQRKCWANFTCLPGMCWGGVYKGVGGGGVFSRSTMIYCSIKCGLRMCEIYE